MSASRSAVNTFVTEPISISTCGPSGWPSARVTCPVPTPPGVTPATTRPGTVTSAPSRRRGGGGGVPGGQPGGARRAAARRIRGPQVNPDVEQGADEVKHQEPQEAETGPPGGRIQHGVGNRHGQVVGEYQGPAAVTLEQPQAPFGAAAEPRAAVRYDPYGPVPVPAAPPPPQRRHARQPDDPGCPGHH